MVAASSQEFEVCLWSFSSWPLTLVVRRPLSHILCCADCSCSGTHSGTENLMRPFWKGTLLNYSKCSAWIRSHICQCWWSNRWGIHRVEDELTMSQTRLMSKGCSYILKVGQRTGFVKETQVRFIKYTVFGGLRSSTNGCLLKWSRSHTSY